MISIRNHRIAGYIFHGGTMKKMTAVFTGDRIRFEDGITSAEASPGTLIPAPLNSHTHIGDSFVDTEPEGDISEVFGPAGFKQRELSRAAQSVKADRMRGSIEFMKNTGACAYMDFREEGAQGVLLVPEVAGIHRILLGRPASDEEASTILAGSSGFSASALSDADFDKLLGQSELARSAGKLFALHFSERIRENIADLLRLKPDFIVHSIEATDSDLEEIAKAKIPVVITPRSNIMFGKRPNYARFIRHGITLMLGTDNCMTVEPDIFAEMSFLYRYQRSLERISPEEVIRIASLNPQEFLRKKLGTDLSESYVFFPDVLLTAYDVVSRNHMWKRFPVNSESY